MRKNRKPRLMMNISKCWQLYLLMLPAFASVVIFHYIPIYGAQIAFKDYRTSLGIAGSEWVGFKHFVRFLTYPDFKLIMKNTVVLSVYEYLTFPLSIILALSIDEIRNKKFKKTVQMVTYAPYFVSTIIVVSMLNLFFARGTGFVNAIIENLGGERIAFLEKTGYFPAFYVWSGVWSGLGWGTIVYLAALAGVSEDLIEAAKIDGASHYRVFWSIVMPVIKPAWLTLMLFAFRDIWAEVPNGTIFSEQLKTLPQIVTKITAGGTARAGSSMAVTVIMMIPPIIVFLISQSNVVEAMSSAGIKE